MSFEWVTSEPDENRKQVISAMTVAAFSYILHPLYNSSRKKYEIATGEVGNPIKQDEKKGILREVRCFDDVDVSHRFSSTNLSR